MKTIYLCGGMRGTWQDQVMAARPELAYRDPRCHGLDDEKAYTAWDLAAVRDSDLVFAYMTADNPSGYGLSLEIGYARALGKQVWFVSDELGPRHRYFGMVRVCADRTFTRLDDALAAFKAL